MTPPPLNPSTVYALIRVGTVPGADGIDDTGQRLFALPTLLRLFHVDARAVISELERDGIRISGQRLDA